MIIIGTFAVIHRGYLDILDKYPEADIFVLSDDLAKELYKVEIDLRKMPVEKVKSLLSALNRNVKILNQENLPEIAKEKQIILINDDVIKELKKKYLADHPGLVVENGFFYHPQEKICRVEKENAAPNKNYQQEDVELMKQALATAKESGCFWRQIASIIVKDGKVIYSAYNKMLPNNDECYKIGCIRDNFESGVEVENCSAVHSEASCIAMAAKDGISLKGSLIYITTFPCPACAKLVALSGIKKCFYNTGWANFDGERVMKAAGMEVIKIDI